MAAMLNACILLSFEWSGVTRANEGGLEDTRVAAVRFWAGPGQAWEGSRRVQVSRAMYRLYWADR
jgi:hypothetical protein